MADIKQGYAQQPFRIGETSYEIGDRLELPYETDEEKAGVDSIFTIGLLAKSKPDAPAKTELEDGPVSVFVPSEDSFIRPLDTFKSTEDKKTKKKS